MLSKKVKNKVSVDQQIYNDVYSAQDLLLAEANRIINAANNIDEEKYERLTKLSSLGFSNAQQVKEMTELQKQKTRQQELKKYIEYYAQTYPFNKFINEESVETICKKYGLLLAAASDYISDIPEENQRHIIDFKVRQSDITERHSTMQEYGVSFARLYDRRFFTVEEASDDFDEQLTAKLQGLNPQKKKTAKSEMVQGTGLKIIAPEHKLDMRYKEKRGYKLEVKDPIVLQPVKGGYLIVTSWGLEASDELVRNERLS